ncbi:hypothetical protein [Tahibacter caeni]|uniref:hypothetical protein n=1 Tax=Tahibacter caeni TaxID=1453545 RepID=UPI00214778E9|nr:hypothetical protein [Tahibacter caeni]
MQRYASQSGKPYGATGFEIEPGAIVVRFRNGRRYRYTLRSCGAPHVRAMKRLALAGEGLSTYVAQRQPEYEDKF